MYFGPSIMSVGPEWEKMQHSTILIADGAWASISKYRVETAP
jgi:hypothetical protein